ncbi:MAG TPA: hypothetical protein VKB16_09560, partial [Beijerinckiaceae bacterium]|nr:hypothetical protein [Beijerinckiaceae bacterium]
MLHSDFLAHLAERGALRDPQALDAGLRDRRPETRGEFDWVGLTKLTQSGFAEELRLPRAPARRGRRGSLRRRPRPSSTRRRTARPGPSCRAISPASRRSRT